MRVNFRLRDSISTASAAEPIGYYKDGAAMASPKRPAAGAAEISSANPPEFGEPSGV
jgi:hypothetical protein